MALNEVGQSRMNARYDIVPGACFILPKQPGGRVPRARNRMTHYPSYVYLRENTDR
jgi:hypothetical protein